MKHLGTRAVVDLMRTSSVLGFSRSTPASSPPTRPAVQPVTAAMTGVVRTADGISMVVARSNSKRTEKTFQITASTTLQRAVAPGDTVAVRYRFQDGRRVATVVTVKAPEPHDGE